MSKQQDDNFKAVLVIFVIGLIIFFQERNGYDDGSLLLSIIIGVPIISYIIIKISKL